jgi:hypothetical protein
MTEINTRPDLTPGTTYHVEIGDCCVAGYFTAELTSREDDDDGYPDTLTFANGVTLTNLLAVNIQASRHLRSGQRVRVTTLGEGTITGKHTRGLTEVISYTVQLDRPIAGLYDVEVAPDRIQAIS